MNAGRPPASDPRVQIATEVLRFHEESYGTGADGVAVHLVDNLVIVVLDELELSAGERTLIDGGYSETVTKMRSAYQAAIESSFRAIVERAIGRRVGSFLGTTSLAPPYSVEIFRLEPVDTREVGLADPTAE